MAIARSGGKKDIPRGATATLMGNEGAGSIQPVLVCGGIDNTGAVRKECELYDPSRGTFTATGSMTIPRTGHIAISLGGAVLVTGGITSTGKPVATAELYSSGNGTWSAVASMNAARSSHAATMLNDGRVLVVGGTANPSDPFAEYYDLKSKTWTVTGGTISNPVEPGGATIYGGDFAVTLASGKVLIDGEIYDPLTGQFSQPYNFANSCAYRYATATPLFDGRVLIAGAGAADAKHSNVACVYDPSRNQFTAFPTMKAYRIGASATLLPSGQVLVAGGQGFNSSNGSVTAAQSSAELFNPGTVAFSLTGSMEIGRATQAAAPLQRGLALIAGGFDQTGTARALAELYAPPGQPAVKIMTPLNNSIVYDTVAIQTEVSEQVTGIDVYIDGKLYRSSPPYVFFLDTTGVPDGFHAISVNAFDSSGQTIGSDSAAITVANGSFPAVKITNPVANSKVVGTVSFQTIVNHQTLWIDTFVDGRFFKASPPYNFNWDSTQVANGNHTLSATAFNLGGQQLGSDSLTVSVQNGKAVTITAPASGSIVSEPVQINTTVQSQVSWIDVYIDGKFFKASPPYSFSWDSTTVPNGSHQISATAFNNLDQQIGTDSVTVTVQNKAVTITSPANGSIVSGTAQIGSTVEPQVVWIDIYIDGKFFKASPPYIFDWDSTTVPNGTHQISAAAFNNQGQKIGTDSVTVMVHNGAVTILSPKNGSTVSGAVQIYTTVQPQVLWIDVYIDGQSLATSPPYTFSWNSTTVPNGTHQISAAAFNNQDQEIGTDQVSVKVSN